MMLVCRNFYFGHFKSQGMQHCIKPQQPHIGCDECIGSVSQWVCDELLCGAKGTVWCNRFFVCEGITQLTLNCVCVSVCCCSIEAFFMESFRTADPDRIDDVI